MISFNKNPNTQYILRGRKTDFFMILYHLIKNSKFATRKIEKPKIEIDFKEIDGYNILTISDNGEGLSNENIEKATNLGFSKWGQSEGLGLYFINSIIEEEYNGFVEIKSKPFVLTKVSLKFLK
jgi:sensor histidine kinase regulating citrate/malate metabolism